MSTTGLALTAIVAMGTLCPAADQKPTDAPSLAVHTLVPTRSQTFYVDLDSVPGVFSAWRHEDIGELTALRAVLPVPRLRKDSQWRPSFMILLASADKKDAANDVGLQILTLTGKSPLDMRIAGHPGGKNSPRYRCSPRSS